MARESDPLLGAGPAGRKDAAGGTRALWERISPRVRQLVPIVEWGPAYDRSKLLPDVIAGVTVGVMSVPQCLAYAGLAGLPQIYGLYSCFIGVFVYTCLGTSQHLHMGPTAVVSIMTADLVERIVDADDDEDTYVSVAIGLSFLSGVLLMAFGLLNAGFVAQFISQSVLCGFTSGAGVIIFCSQLSALFGFDIPGDHTYETIYYLFRDIGQTNGPTLVLGLSLLAVLFGSKYLGDKKPALKRVSSLSPLLVVVIGITLCYTLRLDKEGVTIVGDIPSGLPKPAMPDMGRFESLIGPAFILALIMYMEGISIAKSIALRSKQEIMPNQEFYALGMSNIVASFFLSYPTSGSFSRSAVTFAAGGRSQLAQVFVGLVVLLTLLLLTSVFFYLPENALAAIVIAAVPNLLTIKEALFLWHLNKREFAIFMVAFLATAIFGIEEGLMISVVASLLLFVVEAALPAVPVLGHVADSLYLVKGDRHPEAVDVPGVSILRIEAPMFFANAGHLRRHLEAPLMAARAAEQERLLAEERAGDVRIEELSQTKSDLRLLVIDMSAVVSVDWAGIQVLRSIWAEYRTSGVAIHFATVGDRVLDMMERSSLLEEISVHKPFYATIHDAVSAEPV